MREFIDELYFGADDDLAEILHDMDVDDTENQSKYDLD